mmetsp:Transcript_105702/g.315727  ORF Transcript_105702/g.315727 Transcript_105702/m.315727 type:complete len:521 (+) Transcript_105702:97-1659(+)
MREEAMEAVDSLRSYGSGSCEAWPGSSRLRRRAMSAPAPESIPALDMGQDWIITVGPPNTPSVRQKVREGGPSLTLLDVAYDILERMQQAPENNILELLFVRDCLKAGREKTAVPCVLLASANDSGDEVNDYLLRTYAYATSSASSVCGSTGSPSRGPDAAPDFGLPESEPPVWPVEAMSEDEMSGLQALLGGDKFDAWSLDIFEVSRLSSRRPLLFVGWEALRRNGCFSELQIPPEKAQLFLERVESMYMDESATPYHNKLHAADVTQLVHSLVESMGFSLFFDGLSRMALIMAAMTHDIGHNGRNNAFHVNTSDELALTYNDRSVMENYHIAQAFKLLTSEPSVNLLAELPRESLMRTRKEMIEVVLGTDMAGHFDRVSNFKGLVARLDTDPADWEAEPEALTAMRVMVVHAADTSTPAKPPSLADRWTELLQEEFFLQGDEERELSMPISPMCDRRNLQLASSQVGFIKFIVQPAFATLAAVVPAVESEVLVHVEANASLWERRKLDEEQAKEKGRI